MGWLGLAASIVVAVLAAGVADAQDGPSPAPPAVDAKSFLLLDYASGKVLAESEADTRLAPASLTKLMTAYVVFKALKEGRIRLDDETDVSEQAWRRPGSRMFIEVGTRVRVEDLLRGMIIQSGNDASLALAEHVAGSEESFLDLMNEQAAALGMSSTAYRNTGGLPAREHYSTARDLAILARAVIADFPDYYGWYSEREFTYNGIKQHNRNALLWRDSSVDGLKTGHTNAAGYCLVSSAERSGMRLIAVVLGAETPEARTSGSQALLDYGFNAFETHKLYSAGQELTAARVWKGRPEITSLGLAQDLFVTIPRGRYEALSASMSLPSRLVAPLAESIEVGEVEVQLGGQDLSSVPLVSLREVAEAGLWTKVVDGIMLWMQ